MFLAKIELQVMGRGSKPEWMSTLQIAWIWDMGIKRKEVSGEDTESRRVLGMHQRGLSAKTYSNSYLKNDSVVRPRHQKAVAVWKELQKQLNQNSWSITSRRSFRQEE